MANDKNAPNLNQQNSTMGDQTQDPSMAVPSVISSDTDSTVSPGADNVSAPESNLVPAPDSVPTSDPNVSATSPITSGETFVNNDEFNNAQNSNSENGDNSENEGGFALKSLAEKISSWGSKATKDDTPKDLSAEPVDPSSVADIPVAPEPPATPDFPDNQSSINVADSFIPATDDSNSDMESPDILAHTDNSIDSQNTVVSNDANSTNETVLDNSKSMNSEFTAFPNDDFASGEDTPLPDTGEGLLPQGSEAKTSDLGTTVAPDLNSDLSSQSVSELSVDTNLVQNPEDQAMQESSDSTEPQSQLENSGLDMNSNMDANANSNINMNVPNSQSENNDPVANVQMDQGSSSSSPTSNGFPYTIEQILQRVMEVNASDLHLAVGYPPMLRIDGVLQPLEKDLVVTEDIIGDLILPVLPENKRELLEVNREVDLAYELENLARFRINAFYEQGEMSAAFRLIPSRIRSIEELKLPAVYHQFSKLNQGFVLVTGPTGHGKSTTIAAIIQEINENYGKHIITIEDPIEYIYPKSRAVVVQREMHEDTHSWDIALRSAMREDPDVVLVGEMRDFETIAAAITLAETGHLVFATLHTNNAAQTIDRIIDVFPENQQAQVRAQLASTLEAVISQRLIPLPKGGRRAASEVMISTSAVKNLIREGKSFQLDNVIRTSADMGMLSMEQSLVQLVRDGEIRVEDAENYALYPDEVIRLLKRG